MHILVATHVKSDMISDYVCTLISLTETAKTKLQSLIDQTKPLFLYKEFSSARFVLPDDHGYPVIGLYWKSEIDKFFDLEKERLPIFRDKLDPWFSKNPGVQPIKTILVVHDQGNITLEGEVVWKMRPWSSESFGCKFDTAYFFLNK